MLGLPTGGLDLGLERALGVDWRWHCEKDDAASKILEARWPGVPNHGDLFDTDWSQVERVDLVAAGFPCPDYSLAGRRAGIDGEHGQVWLAVATAVRALRPRYLVLENVDGIRSAAGPLDGAPGESAVGVVLADLADLGYRWAYDRLGASDVGAPHRRLRWFCVATLSPAAVAAGVGVDADRRVLGRGTGVPRRGRPAPPALASGQEVDDAADALADGADAAADAVGVGRDGGRGGDADPPAGGRQDGRAVAQGPPAPDRLLPTPTAQDGDSSSGSDPAWGHGVTLTDAARGVQADAREPRLLPTPQAADGDGGRMERGAMGHAGVRPSGHKATLPLPTAVSMRDELTETPFTRPDEAGQLDLLAADDLGLAPCGCPWDDNVDADGYCACCGAHLDDPDGMYALQIHPKHFLSRCPLYGLPVGGLLPTPVANSENPGAGGELRAAIVHGEGRRNETGIVTLGRPNEGRPRLLPTPVADDESSRGRQTRADGSRNDSDAAKRSGAHTLTDIARLHPSRLLPTPTTQDGENTAGPSQRERHADALHVVAADALLPTATAADGDRTSEQFSRHYTEGADNPTLQGAAARAEVEWGVYGAAVRRWELVCGRDAPAPTDEKGRLAPAFVEWMLGYPAGWFDVEGVSRTRKLRALGNSVQVQCAEAVGGWLAFLVESGLLA